LWWTKWHWGRLSPSTSVSSANYHSTDCSTFVIIRRWYSRPISGRRTKWTQSHPTPRNKKKKKKLSAIDRAYSLSLKDRKDNSNHRTSFLLQRPTAQFVPQERLAGVTLTSVEERRPLPIGIYALFESDWVSDVSNNMDGHGRLQNSVIEYRTLRCWSHQ
jgi:hypothetical protein